MKGCWTIIAFLFSVCMQAQIERDGSPLTWQVALDHITGSIWQTLTPLDVELLLAEDALEANDKSKPLRFAKRMEVHVNFNTMGRWTNLSNGDRIWMCGIEVENAYALSFSIAQMQIPEGSSIYFYTSDKSDFIGPLTRQHNTDDQPFITPPVDGHRVVIEYYEPYAFRGRGSFTMDAVAASYRDLKNVDLTEYASCWNPLTYSVNNTGQVNASSSVLLSIVDDGQRLGTSVLLNNTASNGIPYLMTAQSALMGLPSRWLFLFDVAGSGCLNPEIHCWNKAICGGIVKELSTTSGIALIRLRDMPRQNWTPYYSGWQTDEVQSDQRLFLIHHALGMPQSLAEYQGEVEHTTWNGWPVVALSHWDDGATFKGSVGSPLFDENLNLVGIQVGGDLNCSGAGKDYFAMIAGTWDSFKDYLDPFVTGQSRFDGEFPVISNPETSDANVPFVLFPNPAQGWLYVRNQTNEPLQYIEITDGAGRLVDAFQPMTPSLDIQYLPEGVYFVLLRTATKSFTQRLLVR